MARTPKPLKPENVIPVDAMGDWNPRYKEVTISVLEIVPPRDLLPTCSFSFKDGFLCNYKAKYMRNGKPSCGFHVGQPSTLFLDG